MDTFFSSPTSYIGGEGQIHIYALPDHNFAQLAAPYVKSLSNIDCVGVQPANSYHATVLRLQPADTNIAVLAQSLRNCLRGTQTVKIELQSPIIKNNSVLCIGEKTPAWDNLTNAVLSACQAVLGKVGTPYVPPFGPHITLAYGIKAGDDNSILPYLGEAHKFATLNIDSLAIVRVFQDRDAGTYTFSHLAEVTW